MNRRGFPASLLHIREQTFDNRFPDIFKPRQDAARGVEQIEADKPGFRRGCAPVSGARDAGSDDLGKSHQRPAIKRASGMPGTTFGARRGAAVIGATLPPFFRAWYFARSHATQLPLL